jgi:hypothetical protein
MGNCRFRKNVANSDRWSGYRGGQLYSLHCISSCVMLLEWTGCEKNATLDYCKVSTGCSKSHATHGLLGIYVSWTPHFKEIVASTIAGLKPLRLLFTGASQGYCVLKSSTHTARASGQHSARCGQDINWNITKRVR